MDNTTSNSADRENKNTPERHAKMTSKRKAGYDKKQAKATKEKGLLIVNTGTGKGKPFCDSGKTETLKTL